MIHGGRLRCSCPGCTRSSTGDSIANCEGADHLARKAVKKREGALHLVGESRFESLNQDIILQDRQVVGRQAEKRPKLATLEAVGVDHNLRGSLAANAMVDASASAVSWDFAGGTASTPRSSAQRT